MLASPVTDYSSFEPQSDSSPMHPYIQVYFALVLKRPREAFKIACWWITGRRVRALGRFRNAASSLSGIYRHWIAHNQPDRMGVQELAILRKNSAGLSIVAVHLHITSADSAEQIDTAVTSVLDQFYPRWELYVTSAVSNALRLFTDPRINTVPPLVATQSAGMAYVLRTTAAPYVVPLTADCALTPGALLAYAQAIREENAPVVLYADQDELSPQGKRCNPWFKPKWDGDLFLAQDYLSAACALPAMAAHGVELDEAIPDTTAIYKILSQLLLGSNALAARHIPHVATTTSPRLWSRSSSARTDLVRNISRESFGAKVTQSVFGTLVIQHHLPVPPPKVSIIVPTRDRLDLLATCVRGVLHGTDYPSIELVIADNESVERDTLAFFELCARDSRVRVVRWPYPYNYSAINNFAVRQASGSYICLLNNDTEVIDPAWLHELMVHAVRPEIGAVGARLLYPDRTIQHAGVVVGIGGAAGHAHRGLAEGEPGYFAQALVARSATAVTAACLVVSADKFNAVSGFDEENLAIAYNDVDLCLKLRNAGWRNMYIPQSVLIHHESKSRGPDLAPQHFGRYKRELAIFQERWGTVDFQDPAHHPGLDPMSEEYRLGL